MILYTVNSFTQLTAYVMTDVTLQCATKIPSLDQITNL